MLEFDLKAWMTLIKGPKLLLALLHASALVGILFRTSNFEKAWKHPGLQRIVLKVSSLRFLGWAALLVHTARVTKTGRTNPSRKGKPRCTGAAMWNGGKRGRADAFPHFACLHFRCVMQRCREKVLKWEHDDTCLCNSFASTPIYPGVARLSGNFRPAGRTPERLRI